MTELAAWAWSATVPAFSVGVGPGGALVGPLTNPGRPGCGHCARQRMRAAATHADGEDRTAPGPVSHDVIRAVRRLVLTEVAAWPATSRLVDHVVRIGPDAETHSRHRVIPLSRCRVCGGAARLTERPSDDGVTSEDPSCGRDDGETSELAGWVDPLTGVFPALLVDPPANDARPSPVVITVAPAHVEDEDDTWRCLPTGWGKGPTAAEAVRSALGEAIERYGASLPDPDRLVWERPHDLQGDRLDPRLFSLYGAEQYAREDFPYVQFDPGARHPWVRGRWLDGGSEVWVPAVFAFLSMTIGPENLICQGTSNGLAAFPDAHEAALRATLELVERDAFMAAWLTGAPGTRVAVDETLSPALGAMVASMEAHGGCVELYLLPTAACGSAALCLALGDGTRAPGVTIGLGADLDPRTALRQAILEAAQTRPYLSRRLRSEALRTPADAASVRDMIDHAAYYFPLDRATAFDPIRSGGAVIPLSSLADWESERTLDACADALRAAGVRVALVDVTSPDVATGPFRVVRAVSPDLQTISYGHGLERLPVERIRDRVPATRAQAVHPIW